MASEKDSASPPGAGRPGAGAQDSPTDPSFRFRAEDDLRAAVSGGFSSAPAEGGSDGQMRGGFGGEGYTHYGSTSGTPAQGGGAEGPAYFGDHGSNPDGTPRTYGSEGEENFDRSARPEVETRMTGQGSAQFSNGTAADRTGRGGAEGGGSTG